MTNKDLEEGNNQKAEERMNAGDGGLTRHAIRCNSNIAWEKSKIVGKERGWTQRKCLEGIESLRRKDRGEEPINSYNKMEQWQPVLLEEEKFRHDFSLCNTAAVVCTLFAHNCT